MWGGDIAFALFNEKGPKTPQFAATHSMKTPLYFQRAKNL